MENNERLDGSHKEENEKIKKLKEIVDEAGMTLREAILSEREARDFIEETRGRVLLLFPDKKEEFDLIYRPRFERLMNMNPGVQVDRDLRKDTMGGKGGRDGKF